jgi:hypothetical protein
MLLRPQRQSRPPEPRISLIAHMESGRVRKLDRPYHPLDPLECHRIRPPEILRIVETEIHSDIENANSAGPIANLAQ